MKKKYQKPCVESYSKHDLETMIEAGACSAGFECHCYGGAHYT